MKLSTGFTQLLPSVSMVIFYGISLTWGKTGEDTVGEFMQTAQEGVGSALNSA